MTTGELTDFLIAEIDAADGDTAFVEQLLEKAKAAIIAGKGIIAPLTSGSQNGRSYTAALQLGPVEVAAACRAALDYAAEGDDQKGVSSSRLDFSDL